MTTKPRTDTRRDARALIAAAARDIAERDGVPVPVPAKVTTKPMRPASPVSRIAEPARATKFAPTAFAPSSPEIGSSARAATPNAANKPLITPPSVPPPATDLRAAKTIPTRDGPAPPSPSPHPSNATAWQAAPGVAPSATATLWASASHDPSGDLVRRVPAHGPLGPTPPALQRHRRSMSARQTGGVCGRVRRYRRPRVVGPVRRWHHRPPRQSRR